MTSARNLPSTAWRKSSYSGQGGGNCLEAALHSTEGTVPVRDSKNPHGPALLIPAAAWQAFVTRVRAGAVDSAGVTA
ncbi:DUF397 domain-containing protein [Streptomyces boncukensis]|uniref:DUF397 domain-containing protein n=1 Tax=Streptomyces boncukensis TaxID=2711219 RepID=A0A6G4WTG6_9ACTN|nr:DUF397 domain-containing protein [Streptomyces boncukensis]NGO67761.1 DUF397 domain-containing protein [Streptomyces boncukensis]